MRMQWEEDPIFGNDPVEEGIIPEIIGMIMANESAKKAATPPPAPVAAPASSGINLGDVAALIAAIRGTDPKTGGDPATGAMVGSLAARGLAGSSGSAPASGGIDPVTGALIGTSLAQSTLGSIASPGTDESRLERIAGSAARTVDSRLGPQLSRIRDALDYQQTQATATSEHRGIVSRDQYRQAVLGRLDRLQAEVARLRPGSPARTSMERAIRVTLR